MYNILHLMSWSFPVIERPLVTSLFGKEPGRKWKRSSPSCIYFADKLFAYLMVSAHSLPSFVLVVMGPHLALSSEITLAGWGGGDHVGCLG